MDCAHADFPHHLPSLENFSDVISLFCLSNVVILGQILYQPYYDNADVMVDQFKDQLFKKGRQEAQELLTFLARNYSFTLENRPVDFYQLFAAYLVLQIRCMIQHAMLSRDTLGPQPVCTVEALVESISAYFFDKPWFLEELRLQQKRRLTATTYAWKFDEEYTLRRRTYPTFEGMDFFERIKLKLKLTILKLGWTSLSPPKLLARAWRGWLGR